MKKRMFFIPVLISFLLAGCADTPSEVKEEIDAYEDAKTAENAEIAMLPFGDVLEQARRFKSDNSTNIAIENLILPDSQKMPDYNVKFYNDKADDLFTMLQSEPLFSNDGSGRAVNTPDDFETWLTKKDYCFTTFPELEGINYYRKASDVQISDWGVYYGQNMRMTKSGSISLYPDEENTGIGPAHNYPVKKRILSGFYEETEKCTLCDGTSMSAADAAAFAEGFCNARLPDSENNCFKYQVNYMDVRSVENDNGYYVSLCRRDSYGNLFDATAAYPFAYEEFEARNALIASPIHLWITSSDNIAEFEKNYTFILEEAGANEKIVSLEAAVKELSNALAQGRSYSFDTAELKYVFEAVQSDYIDAAREYVRSGELDDDIGIVYSPDSIYAYGGCKIKAVPYWVFTDIDITAQSTDTNCGGIYMVNALDGSLRIENVDGYGNQQIYY